MNARELAHQLDREGVALQLAGDLLKFTASKGPVTPERVSQIREHKAELVALLEQARAEKVAIADLLRAELAPLLAELEALADRWDRGVRWIDHGGDPDLAYRRFCELANQAGVLSDAIEALAPGASHGLLARLWAADDALLEAAA